jgi:ABC-type sugar transport system ATPase subunit
MGLCDRILVMAHGEIQREFERADFRQEQYPARRLP